MDIRYNSPHISSSSGDDQTVADCSGFNLNNRRLSYTTRHPQFFRYLTRLATFSTWRRDLDPRCLAENGFYYQGIGDTIICYSCGVSLMHWNPDDDALLQHLRYSPNCKHLENKLDRTTIADYLGQNNYSVDKRVCEVDKQTKNDSRSSANFSPDKSRPPRNPEYQSMSVRVSTFARFPNYKGIRIGDLADAGFYYAGVDDLVRCYWCDLGLKEWNYGDDPYLEHAKHLAECVHLRRVKGKEFVAHVLEAEKQKLHKMNLSSNKTERKSVCTSRGTLQCSDVKYNDVKAAISNAGQRPDKETHTSDILYTPAAQSVLQFGYSKELVLAAVTKLKSNGHSSLTAMQILEVILNAEDRKIDLLNQEFKMVGLQNETLVNGVNDDAMILAKYHLRNSSLLIYLHHRAGIRDMDILQVFCRSEDVVIL